MVNLEFQKSITKELDIVKDRVRNLIGSRDEESAELADLNYDGVVNAVDFSCMVAALSVRWDEE